MLPEQAREASSTGFAPLPRKCNSLQTMPPSKHCLRFERLLGSWIEQDLAHCKWYFWASKVPFKPTVEKESLNNSQVQHIKLLEGSS